VRPRLWHIALAVAYLGAVLGVMRTRLTDNRFDLASRLLETAILALTPPNLLGPIRMFWKGFQARGLAAGEILWACTGIVWVISIAGFQAHDRVGSLQLLAWLAGFSGWAATIVSAFARRPRDPGEAWAHHTGWALLECDVIVWGFIAWGLLS